MYRATPGTRIAAGAAATVPVRVVVGESATVSLDVTWAVAGVTVSWDQDTLVASWPANPDMADVCYRVAASGRGRRGRARLALQPGDEGPAQGVPHRSAA